MPLRRNLDHTVEWYYNMNYNKSFLIQYHLFSQFELKEKVVPFVDNYDSTAIVDYREDLYGIFSTFEDFEFINYSSFYTFFTLHKIDIPTFFRDIRSLKRSRNDIEILKFNNYFMRMGKRYQSLKFLYNAIELIKSDFNTLPKFIFKVEVDWQDFFYVYHSFFLTTGYVNMAFREDELATYGNVHSPEAKHILTEMDIKRVTLRNIYKMLPMFAFYIYKVDKQIYKNTRGKSGKYTFIWKYVTSYKRPFLVMSWILRELRVTPGRSLIDRLTLLLRTLVFSPDKTWIFRIKRFSTNYVYRNCRKTLAENYITVKR